MIGLIFLLLVLVAMVDVAVKEFYVKDILWIERENGLWGKVPNFWKDMIADDHWYRIRWAMVLNGAAVGVAWFLFGWQGAGLYLYLACCNWEHIFYQWLRGLFRWSDALFDLPNHPAWMEGLPWNKWLARRHGENVVSSEEILTVAVIGTGMLLITLNLGGWL